MHKISRAYTDFVIIGNGFDLNLKLKTSYTDFMQSDDFKQLTEGKNPLALYLESKHNLHNWIDIENELKKYSIDLKFKEHYYSYKSDFNSLSDALKTYLGKIDYKNLDKNAHAYKLLKEVSIKGDYFILDFNYTKTARIILKELGIDDNTIDDRTLKVHGSLAEGHIIFGVEDQAKIKPEHVFLKKAHHPEFKAVNINEQLKNSSELYIFGHSLGESDHMYFNDFFRTYSHPNQYNQGKSIHLYHYGHEGYDKLFMQLDVLTIQALTVFKQNNDFRTIDTSK